MTPVKLQISLPAGLPQSGKLPVLNLLKAKNQVFLPAGATCCTDSGQTWQGRRAPGSTWLCKISPQSTQGWECGPKISKISIWQSPQTL